MANNKLTGLILKSKQESILSLLIDSVQYNLQTHQQKIKEMKKNNRH